MIKRKAMRHDLQLRCGTHHPPTIQTIQVYRDQDLGTPITLAANGRVVMIVFQHNASLHMRIFEAHVTTDDGSVPATVTDVRLERKNHTQIIQKSTSTRPQGIWPRKCIF